MKFWNVDDLVGLRELANELRVTSQAVANWRVRHDTFPQPVKVLQCGPLFSRQEVLAWYSHRWAVNE